MGVGSMKNMVYSSLCVAKKAKLGTKRMGFRYLLGGEF